MTGQPSDLLAKLNDAQRTAVSHRGSPLLVLAGAGSGKTRVITYRVAHLLASRDARPDEVLAVTFTNKAAREMKERIGTLIGAGDALGGMFVGTFHGFALRLLRAHAERLGRKRDFSVFDSADSQTAIRRSLRKLGFSDQVYPLRMLQSRISLAKNDFIPPGAYASRHPDFLGGKVAEVYRAYEEQLVAAGAFDFDDLLLYSVKLLEEHPEVRERLAGRLRHQLVDEYQDTNRVQDRLIAALTGSGENLCAVGDEDQSIYRFRGARLGNILEFERHYPGATTVKLELNYRSTKHILAAASGVVANNQARKGKTLYTERTGGEQVLLYRASDERDEAGFVVRTARELSAKHGAGGIAVLMRTGFQSRPIEEELSRARLPYILIGGVRFYERAEIKDVIAYLRLAGNPDDDISLLRVVNTPARGIGDTTVEALSAAARDAGGSLWRAIVEASPGVHGTRATKALSAFREIVEDLGRVAAAGAGPAKLADYALLVSGLARALRESQDVEDQARLENVQELVSGARAFEDSNPGAALADFLDSVALATDLDNYDAEERFTLMTLHAAKGLEFPVVFMVGMEDGLLPHKMAGEETEDIEEERRLCYVGMTRAEELLYLSWCEERRVFGRMTAPLPSPFLDEIPEESTRRLHGRVRPVAAPYAPPGRTTHAAGVMEFFRGSGATREEPEISAPPSREPVRNAPRPAAESDTGGMRRGTRVRHAQYGSGQVMQVEGSGDSMKVTVYFDRAGRKKLVAKFAQLELVR